MDPLPPPYQVKQDQNQYHPYDSSDEKDRKLKDFFKKYEISPLFREDILCVKDYDIILICDDSASMCELSSYMSLKTNKMMSNTRWDELQETVEVIVELGILLDDDGIDIWFLNRDQPIKNVKCKETVTNLFNIKPSGRTPLTRCLRRVINEPSAKPKLILVVTDGEPNDDDGNSDCNNFVNLLKSRDAKKNRISIIACTTVDAQIEWLNRVDGEVENVDVIDDYISERDQILKVQGSNFSYSQGDHILKMLLGPILQKYCDLDGNKLQFDNSKYTPNNNNNNSFCKNMNNKGYNSWMPSRIPYHYNCMCIML
jgi:hypothetical protein